jgi:hypothetical protein
LFQRFVRHAESAPVGLPLLPGACPQLVRAHIQLPSSVSPPARRSATSRTASALNSALNSRRTRRFTFRFDFMPPPPRD